MPQSLDERRIAEFEQRLHAIHADLLGELDELEQVALEDEARPDRQADEGPVAQAQDEDLDLLEHEEGLLQEVVQALERIREGSYGTCEACGNLIGIERLEALPQARHCIECATLLDPGPPQP